MDANWRWIHDSNKKNCYEGSRWDRTKCPDPQTCAQNCILEAITAQQYSGTYGVSTIPGGLKLSYMTGQSAGSRLYLTEGDRYKMFHLKTREFSFDVDVS